jgi:hypothetical protein
MSYEYSEDGLIEQATAGKKGMIDFNVQINGKNLHYDNTGMPDFVPHTPTVNGEKIKFQAQTLNGSSIDMTTALNGIAPIKLK